jgi:hypothetical protein
MSDDGHAVNFPFRFPELSFNTHIHIDIDMDIDIHIHIHIEIGYSLWI